MSVNIEQLRQMCKNFRAQDWSAGNISTSQDFLFGLLREISALEAKAARLAEALERVNNWSQDEGPDALLQIVDIAKISGDALNEWKKSSPASQEEAPKPPVCEVCGDSRKVPNIERVGADGWMSYAQKGFVPCPACAADKEK